MASDKKKGDFDQWAKQDIGGDKKQREDRNTDSRTGHKQNRAVVDATELFPANISRSG
jgi:hypothetical protein